MPNRRPALAAALFASAELLAGCMSYGQTVVYQLYKENADRCSRHEPEACVAVIESKCQADARVCTKYFPQLQSQASAELTTQCQTNGGPACQGLETIRCDDSDATACSMLTAKYSKLHASCKAGNLADCDTLASLPWPKAQLAAAELSCKQNDAIACRVASASRSSWKLDVDRNARF